MPTPFRVVDQDDPSISLGEWDESGSIRLPGNLTVVGNLTVSGEVDADSVALTAFSKGVILTTVAVGQYFAWYALKPCTVKAVRVRRTGGTTLVVNAQNNASDLLAVDLSAATADTWYSSTTIQNAILAEGATLAIEVVSVSGSPTQATIQIDLETS